MREISKQRIDYRPNIKYTSDYYTQGKTVSQSNQSIENGFRNNRVPLDTYTIPNIENNINFLNTALPLLPKELYKAVKEVYDPICDVFYEELIDKIIDPNPQIPEIIIKPVDPTPKPYPTPNPSPGPNPNPDPNPYPDPDPSDNKGYVFPIILKPIDLKNKPDDEEDKIEDKENVFPIILKPMDGNKDENESKDESEKYVYPIILRPMDNSNNKEESGNETKERVYPIILRPIKDNDDEEEEENRKHVFPIILRPIDDDDNDDISEGEEEVGLWDPPSKKIEYVYPDLNEAINREFVYLLSKVINHYTNRLKDIVNNYLFNIMKCNLQQSEENIDFISNKLELTSNDILNHSKHLLDSSVKSENTAALRTEFFKNVFNIRDTAVYLRSFMVSHELRKRYTNIKYSKGNSMANSMSDSILEKLNIQYELQYRKNFENLFRYLESSLKVIDDILRLYIRDGLSKSTIIKKGGIK